MVEGNTYQPSADTDPDPEAVGSAAVVSAEKGMGRKLVGVCLKAPLFLYLLPLYVVLQLVVDDMRAAFLSVGSYQLTWVEVIHLLATVTAMSELLRVSKPGIDNTREALMMLGVGVVYFALFIFGTVRLSGFTVFNNTEFLMLLIVSWTQVILAFMINARTLKRTIDYTGGGGE